MKYENNWKNKSLENLEMEEWEICDFDSRLIRRIKGLRKIPLENYTIEDLRIMVNQNYSLEYLISIALEKLKENILAEGDLYKGDLLLAVVNCHHKFWKKNRNLKLELENIVRKNQDILKEEKITIELDEE